MKLLEQSHPSINNSSIMNFSTFLLYGKSGQDAPAGKFQSFISVYGLGFNGQEREFEVYNLTLVITANVFTSK
jgi:hypothetical protein